MYFLPISLAIFFLFLFLIPFFIFMLPAVAFAKLGINPFAGLLFFWFCLMGSFINIPIYRKELSPSQGHDEMTLAFSRFFGLQMPQFEQQIVANNLGGAILPGLLCLYLLLQIDFTPVFLATITTTVFSYYLSKPVKGVGIVIPAFIPPIIAALAAMIFAGKESAPPVAYVSGVMGTIIGADLLRLNQVTRYGVSFLSIGGAGVFDGIFIVGIISVLLA